MVTLRRRRRRRCSTSTRRAPTSSPSLLPIFRAHVLTCELISRMQWWLFPCEWDGGNRRKLNFLRIVLVDLSLKWKVKTGPNEKHLWSITTGMIPKLCFTCFNFYSSLFSHTRSGILTSKLIMSLSFCVSPFQTYSKSWWWWWKKDITHRVHFVREIVWTEWNCSGRKTNKFLGKSRPCRWRSWRGLGWGSWQWPLWQTNKGSMCFYPLLLYSSR